MSEEPLPFFAELRKHRPVLATPGGDACGTICRLPRHPAPADVFSVALYKPKQGDYWMAQDDTAVHWREKSIMRAILDREDIPAIRTYVADKAAAILEAANGEIDAVGGSDPRRADRARAGLVRLCRQRSGGAGAMVLLESDGRVLESAFRRGAIARPAKIVAEREAANAAMRTYLIALIQRRAGELQAGRGGNDPVFALLLLASIEGAAVRAPRVVLNVGGLLIGAVETTSHAVVNAFAMLMERPDELARPRDAAASDDPAAVDGFVYEALRFKPPFPYFFRVCEQDTVLSRNTDHETRIAKGTAVLAVTHSAMFDPAAFAQPDRFDPNRGTGNTFHFGLGLHECLGIAIGQVMIAEIVRQACARPASAWPRRHARVGRCRKNGSGGGTESLRAGGALRRLQPPERRGLG